MSTVPPQPVVIPHEAPVSFSLDESGIDEATQRGLILYENRLKLVLEPAYNGQVVAIHPNSEDYFVAQTSGGAMRAMHNRHADGQVLLHVIGTVSADSGLAARMLGTRRLAR